MFKPWLTIFSLFNFLLMTTFSYGAEIGEQEQVLSAAAHQTKTATAYNSVKKEVLSLWAEGMASCDMNIVLKAQIINYLTGEKTGAAFTVFTATENCESAIVEQPVISFDPVNNQYFVMVKTIQGGFKKVIGFLLNDLGEKISQEIEFASSTFGDPYNKLISVYDPVNKNFISGYHIQTGTTEMALHLQKINPGNGQKEGNEMVIDKNTASIPGTSGPKNSYLQFNPGNNKILLLFQAEDATSSEIWGDMLSPLTLGGSGDFFQVSPDGTAGNKYKNASAVYHPVDNEFLVVYEDVDLTGAGYEQVATIYGQKISALNGSKVGPGHSAMSLLSLVGCGSCIEQTKLPKVSFSTVKNEYLVTFYGVPTSSGLEGYHIYGSRIDPETLEIIEGESFGFAENSGSSVNTNNNLQPISILYFGDTDKFLFTWLDHQENSIIGQLRKYQNHAPTGLGILTNSVEENLPVNSLVALLTTEDFDEVDQFTYTLVSGDGDTHNSAFMISGRELRTNQVFNFENASTKSIRVRTTDAFGSTYELAFTIEIIDVNESPTNLTLSNYTVEEFMPVGTFVGKLATIDPDAGDVHEFLLTEGGEYFKISNDSIFTQAILKYNETPEISINVRAIDAGGLEFEKDFTIIIEEFPDFEEPVIVQQNFIDTYTYSKPSEAISIEATDDTGIKIVNLIYRPLSSKDWQIISIEGEDDLYETSITKNMLDETGMVYFFEVSDIKHNVYSDTVTMLITFDDGDITLDNLSFGGKETDYQIISIPYQLTNPSIKANFEDDLGIQNANAWRVLHYQSGECCVEYPTGLQNFERGKGYWFNQKENNTISLGAGKVDFKNEDESIEISLEAGWNQIGNPYPFDIHWTEVIAFSENEQIFQTGEVSNSLYIFQNGIFSKSTLLPAFRGAFISAEKATSLKIPFHSKNTGSGRTANGKVKHPISASHWEVELNLVSGDQNFALAGVGMHPKASLSKDKLDELLLPRFGRFADLHVGHPEYFYPRFAKDIVTTSEHFTWDFIVESSQSNESTLHWDNSYFGRDDQQLFLIDMATGLITEMGLENSYHFSLTGRRNFKIVYGDENYLKHELDKLESVIGLPYPNPFTDQLKIPVILPGINDQYNVGFTVYNNMGAAVFHRQLLLQQNNNTIQWDGLDGNREHIKKGIYFYKVVITNTGKSFSGKVVKH